MTATPDFATNYTHSITSNSTYIDLGNTTGNYTDFEDNLLFNVGCYVWDITTALCLITFVFGTFSWILLPKWRQFRNYVFLNASVACSIDLFLNSGYLDTYSVIWDQVSCLCFTALPYWLVLAAYSFYMNVVKVFSFHPDRVYLYANVFAWLIPALICISEIEYKVAEFTEAVSSILNLLMYLRVLYVLKISGNIRSSSTVSTWQKIRIATVIFVTSGVAIYTPLLIGDRVYLKPELDYLPTFLFLIQLFLMQLMFLTMKYHRSLWMEFICKWSGKQYSVRSMSSARNN